ncbi:MAG: CapA family protein [Candidatus Omnitrophica bacterium]|nr:CapA family protein [Candidatus Omnitrophota bacterium]
MPDKNAIKIIFTGDIMIGGGLSDLIESTSACHLFSHLQPLFSDADIVFGNLEAPLSNEGTPAQNKILLHQHEKCLHILKQLNYSVLSLANNHIMDYGTEAFLDSQRVLNENALQTIGGGKNIHEARKPARFSIKGADIYFLSYSSPSTEKTNPLTIAQNNAPGMAPFDLEIIQEDIQSAKSEGDHIIVSLHWGDEAYRYPFPEQQEFGRKIIEMGADIIVGHHPHLFQGVERYQNGLIFYSLGNFIFGNFIFPDGRLNEWRSRYRRTALVKATLHADQPTEYNLVPMILDSHGIPHVPDHPERLMYEFDKISRPLTKKDYQSSFKRLEIMEKFDILKDKIMSKLTKS